MSERFRRTPHLVCYWRGSHLVLDNYLGDSRVAATPLACEILHAFDRWRPASILARLFPAARPESLAAAVVDLIRCGLLQRSAGDRDRQADARAATWDAWSPAASFFHFSTKNGHEPIEPDVSEQILRRRARSGRVPNPVKRYPRATHIQLPRPEALGELPRVVLERRTWRKLSPDGSIGLDQASTLLGLSFGVQLWLDMPGIGRVALKTSPSGGARHPIEAYVAALNVRGLQRGIYHYDAAGHRLELIRAGVTREEIVDSLNAQWWFGNAAAVVLMTGVFARTQWKYPAPRAYRVVLVDAGHIAQTFCLVATWQGLAPFCTMALSESKIERALRIDGITESVLYAAGVGIRPADVDWPSWEDRPYGRLLPNLSMRPTRKDTTVRRSAAAPASSASRPRRRGR